jgi:hypothetical protein
MEVQAVKEPKGGAALVALAVLALLLFLLLYVASVGPIVWLADRGLFAAEPGSAIDVIYWPLVAAANSSSMVRAALEWYIGFFHVPPSTGIESGLS